MAYSICASVAGGAATRAGEEGDEEGVGRSLKEKLAMGESRLLARSRSIDRISSNVAPPVLAEISATSALMV